MGLLVQRASINVSGADFNEAGFSSGQQVLVDIVDSLVSIYLCSHLKLSRLTAVHLITESSRTQAEEGNF